MLTCIPPLLPPLFPPQAAQDLDNLRLADVPGGMVYAELELSALMLTGSCVDATSGSHRQVRVDVHTACMLRLGFGDSYFPVFSCCGFLVKLSCCCCCMLRHPAVRKLQ